MSTQAEGKYLPPPAQITMPRPDKLLGGPPIVWMKRSASATALAAVRSLPVRQKLFDYRRIVAMRSPMRDDRLRGIKGRILVES